MSCPDCFKGSVHDHGKAQGHEETVHGVRTYVAAPSKTKESKSAIIFITDAFGLELINNKLLADRYSEETGCKVLMPDVIPGGPLTVAVMNYAVVVFNPVGFNIVRWFRWLWCLLKFLVAGLPWMLRSHPSKALAKTLAYARAVKADLPQSGKLGICGFCWGGYLATNLCVETAEPDSPKPLIDAQFTAHPSYLKLPQMVVDAIKTLRVPCSCAVAPKDLMLHQNWAEKIEVQLRREVGPPAENDYEFVIHKDCTHGFAVRANPTNQKAEAQGMEDAAVQAVNWFNKYLN